MKDKNLKNNLMMAVVVVLFSLATMSASGCGTSTAADNNTGLEKQLAKSYIRDVRVSEAITGDVEKTVSRVATITAPEQVAVIPRLSGQLEQLLVEEGTIVAKGQIIAKLENESLRLAEQRAESSLEKYKYDYELLLRQFEAGVVGEEAVNQARFQMNQAKNDLESTQVELDRSLLRAPIGGIVSSRNVSAGDMVFTNTEIVTIVNTKNLETNVMIPQNQIDNIRVGNPVVMIPGNAADRSFNGKVKRISPVIDVDSGTVKVTIGISGSRSDIKPGTFVRVSIITGVLHDVVLIPQDAIVIENAMSVIYKIVDGVAYRINVDLGFTKNGFIQATGNISSGETVVVSGQTGLDDLMKVNIVEHIDSQHPVSNALAD